jgi:hypothetical protein
MDTASRYERLRLSVLEYGMSSSYELAVFAREGMPGWLELVIRFFDDPTRIVPDPSAATDLSTVARAVARGGMRVQQKETVSVLASIVLRCLGG